MAKDVTEKRSEATCSGIKKNEEKPKAPHLEDIHLHIPVTVEEKKQNIEEITVNRKEMVLEVLMADIPNVPAKEEFVKSKKEARMIKAMRCTEPSQAINASVV
ncbi:hypothetical protein L1987_06900 [Smallanthus sonchifolius]|uniref:Uncharacterized protein n=1 Tax=Smallanthus sonchifolius TaxID=185202 RepID=A0ACB9JZL5_9ASTR|nr:hypothetical protein L1987_06900 [Smallanthus sonchifolius]